MAKSVKIGITIGDKNGIGPEVIIKALKEAKRKNIFSIIKNKNS